jgi:hypothetical protein
MYTKTQGLFCARRLSVATNPNRADRRHGKRTVKARLPPQGTTVSRRPASGYSDMSLSNTGTLHMNSDSLEQFPGLRRDSGFWR